MRKFRRSGASDVRPAVGGGAEGGGAGAGAGARRALHPARADPLRAPPLARGFLSLFLLPLRLITNGVSIGSDATMRVYRENKIEVNYIRHDQVKHRDVKLQKDCHSKKLIYYS
uniref:Uncharacterized protein n=1 Tax=Oryza punctata TaxID=4537 RepID=A0A0E0LD87_ORYPU